MDSNGDIFKPGSIKWEHSVPVTLGFGGEVIGEATQNELLPGEVILSITDRKVLNKLIEQSAVSYAPSGKIEGMEISEDGHKVITKMSITSINIIPKI